MYTDRYFEVEDGILLRYVDEGKGLPIIFVPGWSFSLDVFEKQIEYFKGSYRCIAIDPRCHGKSTITHSGNSYNQQGRDIAKLAEFLGLDRFVLAGWSFGALACWAYAEQFGFEKLAGVITMDNSPRSVSDDENEYRAGTFEALCADHHNNLCSAKALRGFMEGFADGLLYEGKLTPQYRQELIDTSCRIPSEIADALYVDGWMSDKREIFKKIDATVPNLLVIANYRKDTGVPYMKENYPHTRIDAFGMHMMFHEYAERFNGLMEEFMAGII